MRDADSPAPPGLLARLRPGASTALRTLLAAAAAAALFGYFAVRRFRGLAEPAAMDYAQLARQIAGGRGYVTRIVRPLALGAFARAGRAADPMRCPDAHHPPLFPAALALGFRLLDPPFEPPAGFEGFAPETRVIVPLGILCSIATAGVIFLMGRRLFDARVGAAAAAGYCLTERVLADSISGLPVPLVALLAAGACHAAASAALGKADGAPFRRWAPAFALAALCCALAVLTRYAAAVLVLPLALYVCLASDRFRLTAFAAFAALVLLGVAPWLWRNARVTPGLLGLAPHQALDDTIYCAAGMLERGRSLALDSAEISLAVRLKLLARIGTLYDVDLRVLGGGLFMALFLASFLHRFERAEANALRWCVAGAMGLLLAVAAVYGPPTARLLPMFLPPVMVFGCAMLFHLVDRLDIPDPVVHGTIAGAVLAAGALPAALTLFGSPAPRPYPPYFAPYAATVAGMMKEGEMLAADIPEATAWYGDRTSLLLPADVADFTALRAEGLPLNGVYLTSVTADKPYASGLRSGPDRSWLPLLTGSIPAGFPLTDGMGLPPGSRDQLFISDVGRFAQ